MFLKPMAKTIPKVIFQKSKSLHPFILRAFRGLSFDSTLYPFFYENILNFVNPIKS